MSVQTYCTAKDVEYILSEHGLTGFVNDRMDYSERSTSDSDTITAFIERAAELTINFELAQVYTPLSLIADHPWCKWANATLAAHDIATRRGNPAPEALRRAEEDIKESIRHLQSGWKSLPGMARATNDVASVSNFNVILGRDPVTRVDTRSSTKPSGAGTNTKRYV